MFKPRLTTKSIGSDEQQQQYESMLGGCFGGCGESGSEMQTALMRIDDDDDDDDGATNEYEDEEDELGDEDDEEEDDDDEEEEEDQENFDEFDENLIQDDNGFAQAVQFYVKMPGK